MEPTDQDNQKPSSMTDLVKSLKDANNILVIISRDPNIDQLSSAIGLTIALNKADKHATAVFSGNIPPILEFLEPEKTLEKNTDSLRDFIISLDKSKADKLRYKVEDNVVRIFITPYKTSISDKDLEFTQGDFNIDAVIALGVNDKEDLDQAILAHGRILHDATIIAISNGSGLEFASSQWIEKRSSSLAEMVTDLIVKFDPDLIDSQIATALLTGVVYETDRFRNEKSTPHSMSVSGILMEAGASTQLIADKLEEDHSPGEVLKIDASHDDEDKDKESDKNSEEPKDVGTIRIEHEDDEIHIDESGELRQVTEINDQDQEQPEMSLPEPEEDNGLQSIAPAPGPQGVGGMVYEPPTFGGQLTANSTTVDQQYTSNPDPLTSVSDNQTLSDLEKTLNSPHVNQYESSTNNSLNRGKTIEPLTPEPSPLQQVQNNQTPMDQQAQIEYASDAVERAVAGAEYKPEPIQALNAQPLGMGLNSEPMITPVQPVGVSAEPAQSITPPPPVPPPMMPQ